MRFEFGEFVLDDSAFELRRAGEPLKVDPKVLDVLAHVVRRPGQLVTKDELIEHVWEGRALSDSVLAGTISRLRKVLGAEGEELLVTVYGRGYRFTGSVRPILDAVPEPSAVVHVPPPTDAPFVGRAAVMERIAAALERARAGSGRIVVVAGEPGIGKTRLAEVAADRAGALGLPAVWSHCLAQGVAPPYWPFVQLLRGALRDGASPASTAAVEHALGALAPDRGAPATSWAADPGSYTLFESVLGALRALADDRPRLLILDDLQWADRASHALLVRLAPEVAHLGLLLLVTARDTEPGAAELLSPIGGHRNCEYLALERLTASEVAAYAALRFERAPEALCSALFEKSEGNAFFMVELLRPYERADEPRPEALGISGPALDIVRQRVASLSAEARALLSAAAVLGRVFDLSLAGQVARFDPAVLHDVVEQACATHTVSPLAARPGYYAFGHDLIRTVLLDALAPGNRAQLHHRAAQSIERRFPAPSSSQRTKLVDHLLSAAPLGDIEHLLRLVREVALSYFRVGAHADAAALLRRGLYALDLSGSELPRVKADLLLGLSYTERAAAEPGYLEHLGQAVALAEREGYGDLLAHAGLRLVVAPGYFTLPRAREVLEAADRALPADGDALRSQVLACLSWTAPNCFEAERASSLVERAGALAARSGDWEARLVALVAAQYLESGIGRSERAAELFAEIETLRDDPPGAVYHHWSAQGCFTQIVAALQRGDHASVERALGAFGTVARVTKHAEMQWHHARASWVERLNQGEWRDAAEALKRLQADARAQSVFGAESMCLADWVVVLREIDCGALSARPELAIAPEVEDCPARWARKVRFLAEAGAPERARAAILQRPAEALERLPRDRDYLGALAHLVPPVIATRCLVHAEVLSALLAPHAELYAADFRLHADGSIAHFLGLLARELGRTREAEQHLEQAVERNQRAFPARAAHSFYELGRLLEEGSPRARAAFGGALELGRRLGLPEITRRAERALA